MKVGKQHGGFLPVPQSRGPWRIVDEEIRSEGCTVLYRGERDVWMDDSELSCLEHEALRLAAYGVVVTTGLGLGFVPRLLLETGRCTNIIVVENDPDIIAMVGPHVSALSPIIELVEADANTYLPERADVYFYDHTYTPAPPDVREQEARRLAGRIGQLLFWDRVQ